MSTKKKYDFLIVGAGLFGAVFAHEAHKAAKKCLVIDKRSHIGGNTYCENVGGINVHKYGPHIFHTNDKRVWDYVNSFVEFNRFTYSPIANYRGELYNLPFNMNTFYQLWKVTSPGEAQAIINEQIREANIAEPNNLEEQAIAMVGKDIYLKLIKGYTEKQWGRSAKNLPAFIIKRLPVRFTYDNNYFNDKYQGIPIGGYNKLTEGLLKDIDVQLNVDYLDTRAQWNEQAEHVIYTGKLDEFFDYRFGKLEYRSLRFETEVLETENYQGNAAVNYTDEETAFTRIVEHKHFEFGTQAHTVISKEYPEEWDTTKEAYYPVNDESNNGRYKKYRELADDLENMIFGGRLAEYKYYDMHQVIASALARVKNYI